MGEFEDGGPAKLANHSDSLGDFRGVCGINQVARYLYKVAVPRRSRPAVDPLEKAGIPNQHTH
jgi:hypothetical protein